MTLTPEMVTDLRDISAEDLRRELHAFKSACETWKDDGRTLDREFAQFIWHCAAGYVEGRAQSQRAVGWMPIDTAPKDTSAIFVWAEGFLPQTAQWDDERNRWECEWITVEPTHWMPIPAGPDAALIDRTDNA